MSENKPNDFTLTEFESFSNLLEVTESFERAAETVDNILYDKEVISIHKNTLLKKELVINDDLIAQSPPLAYQKELSVVKDPAPLQEQKATEKKFLYPFLGIIGLNILIWIIGFATDSELMILKFLFIMLAILSGYLWNQETKKTKKLEKAQDESQKKHDNNASAFSSAIQNYQKEKEEKLQALIPFFRNAPEFSAKADKCLEKANDFLSTQWEKLDRANDILKSLKQQIKNTPFPEDYYDLVPNIITIWQSGRADNYKEALNMAIQEDREQKHNAEMQRIAEERAEQELRLQREAQEEIHRHNLEMENAEQERTAIAREQAKAADSQLSKKRDANSRRCHSCGTKVCPYGGIYAGSALDVDVCEAYTKRY